MPFIFPTAEELEPIVLELELDVESLERLAIYSGLMAYTTDSESEEARLGYLRDNLPKWAEWEQETYYGQHDTPADFTRHYLENYAETDFPSWVKIDYNDTWDCNLRHDFHFDQSGHVWAEVY
jgi:hypothetical protein